MQVKHYIFIVDVQGLCRLLPWLVKSVKKDGYQQYAYTLIYFSDIQENVAEKELQLLSEQFGIVLNIYHRTKNDKILLNSIMNRSEQECASFYVSADYEDYLSVKEHLQIFDIETRQISDLI